MRREEGVVTLDRAMRLSRDESAELFGRHVNHTLAVLLKLGDADIRFTRAEGTRLYDETGRAYLDLTAGYGALNLGHNPPEVIEAVREAQALPAVLLAGFNPLVGAAGKTLAAVLPGDLSVAVFGSGGAEAVEHAMKLARASTGRRKFVSCRGAYHGLSFGALSLCGSEEFRAPVAPALEHCELVPFGDLEALERVLGGGDVAAFVVEPVQGEGGAVVPPQGYLASAAGLCASHGTLLVFDEIQTGYGRTGRMFAMEHEGVTPDIVTLSKSLGSGVIPVSVAVTTEEVWKRAFGSRERFDLASSTFGGNPAACAAILKTTEIMLRDGIPARAQSLGEHAREKLEGLRVRHELVKDVRGRGLLLGIELAAGGQSGENLALMVIGALLHEHGVLTSYYDFDPRVIRFEPPLVATRGEIDEAVDAFDRVLSKGKASLALAFGKSALGRMLHP